jgi:acyl carrier protein
MDNQLATKIIAIVASAKRLKPEEVRADSSFDDLEIDSLDRIEILFQLEEAFNVNISDEEARGIRSVQEIIDRMEAYLPRAESKEAA